MYQSILFWIDTLCFGRSFRPSSRVQDCTYSNRHMSNRYCFLLVSKQTAVSVWLLYVQSWTPDDGRKDRPKHVQCQFKIKYSDTLVHLVGFTRELYYDARRCERQNSIFRLVNILGCIWDSRLFATMPDPPGSKIIDIFVINTAFSSRHFSLFCPNIHIS